MAFSDEDSIPKLTVEIEAQRFSKDKLETAVISLARESPYTLFVNDREILSIATLPTHLKELFIGFLVSEGILLRPGEILECAVDHSARIVRIELDVPDDRLAGLEKKGMLTSGCAGGIIFSVEAAVTRSRKNRKRLKVSGLHNHTEDEGTGPIPGHLQHNTWSARSLAGRCGTNSCDSRRSRPPQRSG